MMFRCLALVTRRAVMGMVLNAVCACSPIPSPQASQPSRLSAGEVRSPSAVTPVAAAEQTAPGGEDAMESALILAQEVAQRTAELYDASKAAAEDVQLRLRIRVVGKPASLVAERERIEVLTGAEGARAADMTVELTKEQARAIVEGTATVRSLVQSGVTQTDNEQGLARFLEFITR